jgi:hypothetical protein
MNRGIAFDWFLFIFGSVPLFVASAFYLITKGRIPFVIGYCFIALIVASNMHGIEMRMDRVLQRIEELEKKLQDSKC